MGVTLSIVILAFNRKDEVLKTVKICLDDTWLHDNAEVIVVDNCSADGTFDALTATYGNSITLLQTQSNIGIAGWNKGFEIAKGRYMLVLDDDSHPEKGIAEAISFLDSRPDVGVLGLNITGGAFTTGHFPDLFEWIGFIGCGAIVRKSVYDKIGGFAEWLFIYTHEFEYGIRVINAGYKILFFKQAVVMHRTSALNRTNQRLIVYSTRNELLIVDKYFTQHRRVNLLKVKLKNLFRYVEAGGVKTLPDVFKGVTKFNEDKDGIVAKPVSMATQQFYQQQFTPPHSVLILLIFYLPKSLLKGIWYHIKGGKMQV